MRFQAEKRGSGPLEMERDLSELAADKILGSAQWTGPDGRRRRRYAVITVREGKIADMQECSSRRQALRFARRNPAGSAGLRQA